MQRAPRVLFVEDDPAVADAVAELLSQRGFEVDVANTGRTGLRRLDEDAHDVCVLDIMLPDISGIDVLTELRQAHRLPVLLLTARSGTNDKVRGLEAGADDYLVKPFDPPELIARLRALLRRSGKLSTDPRSLGSCVLDPATHTLQLGERSAELTAREIDLLETLASIPNKVWTRSQLVSAVWGYDTEVEDRTVDSSVKRLRRKIEQLAEGVASTSDSLAIRSVYGVGYRLDGVHW